MASEATEDHEERPAAEGGEAPRFDAVATAAPGEPAPAGAPPVQGESRLLAATKRHGALVALIAATIFYVFRPRDLAPDGKWYGGMDDIVLLIIVAFLARRAAKSTPALLDLPGIISRAVRRTFGFRR